MTLDKSLVMPSFVEQYIENPTGRTAIFSLIVAAFIFMLTWLIPLSNPAEGDFFNFLYMDISLPAEERFNTALVIIESVLFSFFYLFLAIFLGNLSELRNSIPSWFEIFTSAVITIVVNIPARICKKIYS